MGEWKDKDIGRGFEWERKIDRDKDSEKERVRLASTKSTNCP